MDGPRKGGGGKDLVFLSVHRMRKERTEVTKRGKGSEISRSREYEEDSITTVPLLLSRWCRTLGTTTRGIIALRTYYMWSTHPHSSYIPMISVAGPPSNKVENLKQGRPDLQSSAISHDGCTFWGVKTHTCGRTKPPKCRTRIGWDDREGNDVADRSLSPGRLSFLSVPLSPNESNLDDNENSCLHSPRAPRAEEELRRTTVRCMQALSGPR